MENLLVKYEKLDPVSQREVQDFVDFLLTKKSTKAFDMDAYKERIKNIPTWTDEDVKVFEENAKLFNNWKIEEW